MATELLTLRCYTSRFLIIKLHAHTHTYIHTHTHTHYCFSRGCEVVKYSSWNSPGQNTRGRSFSLLQGIFPTQGLNPGLPHCRQILYQLSHHGSPKHQFFALSLLYGPALTSIHESESHSVVTDSLWPHELYSSWNSPGQNTGVGSLSLLQGIFPTQESNPSLPHCRQILYQLSHKGSPFFSWHKTRKIKVFHYADNTKKPEKTIIIDKFNIIYCFML